MAGDLVLKVASVDLKNYIKIIYIPSPLDTSADMINFLHSIKTYTRNQCRHTDCEFDMIISFHINI